MSERFEMPDRIWLQYYGEDWLEDDDGNLDKPDYPNTYPQESDVTWCSDKIYNSDIEYVRQDITQKRISDLESQIKGLKLIADSHSMSELRRTRIMTGYVPGRIEDEG